MENMEVAFTKTSFIKMELNRKEESILGTRSTEKMENLQTGGMMTEQHGIFSKKVKSIQEKPLTAMVKCNL